MVFDVTGWLVLNQSITGFFNGGARGRKHPFTFNLAEQIAREQITFLEKGGPQVMPQHSNAK